MASISKQPVESDGGEPYQPSLKDFASRYASLRKSLIAAYRRRAAYDPEMLADDVLFRVLKGLLGHAQIREKLEQYCAGVARHVFYESLRRPTTVPASVDTPSTDQSPLDLLEESQRQELLHFAMHSVPEVEYQLWLRYHKEDRKALANELGISPNALRIQVHRIGEAIIAAGQQLLGNRRLK
jgi:hypothetical protein